MWYLQGYKGNRHDSDSGTKDRKKAEKDWKEIMESLEEWGKGEEVEIKEENEKRKLK